ncbi:MAG: response regulator [Deltaproteobacteria bacterium]|nr:response regulator [Deltaproteobacteria bacterium]
MSELPLRVAPLPVIWITDDSPTELAITRRSLGDGFAFETFQDGAEVVERIALGGQLPDVLLLDWVMPGMSGDEVCRFLRAQAATKDLPIIIVTASRVQTTDVVHGLALGANDYVARPFAPEELRARVHAVLRTKQLNDAATREHTRLAAINRLGQRLFEAGGEVQRILEELAATLTETICDGCAILMLPGDLPSASIVRHHGQTSGEELALIASVADPGVFGFDSSEDALASLPPAYHPYINRFGLRTLAILPFPARTHVQGVITVTRDGRSSALDPDDLRTVETCIEYASLAVENALLLTAERTARAQLHAVLEHAPIGIVVTDPMGTVTLANPTACTLVKGIERSAGFGETYRLARWTAPDGAPIGEPEWLATRAGDPRERLSSESIMYPLDGGPARRLVIQTVPLTIGGELIGVVKTIEDVSAQREIAAERERIATFQEQMVAIVSHDLRSPLGAVLVGADAAEMHTAELPVVGKIIGRMRSAAERMMGIIDQLLDVTRARLGTGIPVEPREVSLTPVIRNVLDELAAAHPAVSFELVAHEEVSGVWDPDRLSQVVANLASNAVHYGRPATPIVVEVSASAQVATLTVTNAVRDQPIDPMRLRVLFDPYQRGRDGQHNAHGLGLGLYIVSEIVRAHHGTIAAESTRAGTVFRIELPRDARRHR